MKTINYLVVEVDEQYANEVSLKNGSSLVVNTTIESVEHINRIGKVVKSPDFVIIEEGDEVLVHHNIFRKRNSQKGNEVQSDYFIKDNLFFVPLDEVFMYKRCGQWESLDPYCFVRPVKDDSEVLEADSDLLLPSNFEVGYKGYKENIGEIVYPNKELSSMGLSKGDLVSFTDDSEYEFEVDGEILYRMKTSDVLAMLVCEGSE
jgi:hypothetical protein